MHLLFEASLTQPNSANLLGKKSEQQRGTGPSYMWKSMARCPFEIRHEAKQRQTKWQAQTKKSCRLLFVFLRVAFCFQDLFRSSHLRAVFLLRVASFFGFPAACALLIFAPSTRTHLLVDLLSKTFCFSFCNHDCRTHGRNGCVECLPLAFCHRPCSVLHQQLAHACGNMFGVHWNVSLESPMNCLAASPVKQA